MQKSQNPGEEVEESDETKGLAPGEDKKTQLSSIIDFLTSKNIDDIGRDGMKADISAAKQQMKERLKKSPLQSSGGHRGNPLAEEEEELMEEMKRGNEGWQNGKVMFRPGIGQQGGKR